MKSSISFNKETLPLFVLFLVFVATIHLGFFVFFSDLSTTSFEKISGSIYLVDNLTWLPTLLFLMYFYIYRMGRISNGALRNSAIALIIAAVPKLILMAILLMNYKSIALNDLIAYLLEFVAWFLVILFVIAYWVGDFKLKKHHHHHHHHHSSENDAMPKRKNSKLGVYEHHTHSHHKSK